MSEHQAQIDEAERELDELRAMQAEIARRLAETTEKQREALRLKAAAESAERLRQEQEKPIEVRATDFNGMLVNVKLLPDKRSDVLEALKATPGRLYDWESQTNRVPVEHWEAFKARVTPLPNLKVTHALGVAEKIHKHLNQPEFHVVLDRREIRVMYHQLAYITPFLMIPGLKRNSLERTLTLPISEAYKLIPLFEEYERGGEKRKIVWNPDAWKVAADEAERRVAIDTIATQEDAPDITPIFFRDQQLHPFQRVGVKFIKLTDGLAFLGDQMGLGKTWQAIAYAVVEGFQMTVVICPAHLKANWSREITNLTGEPPIVLYGQEPNEYAIATLLTTKPKFVVINYDILGAKTETDEEITVDEHGRQHVKPAAKRFLWAELLNMAKPDLVVLDEAHYIKNSDSNRSKAARQLKPRHRLPMSGTPILNRPGEFWPALNWLRPDLFPSEETYKYQFTDGRNGVRNVAQLREMLKTIMIRRLKKDVLDELPPLNTILRSFEMSQHGIERYREVLKGVYRAIDRAGNEVLKNVTHILVELGKLKEVCAHDAVDHVVKLVEELRESDQDNGKGKILITSYYKDVVHKIAQALGEGTISWTGETSMENRTELENRFQNDPNINTLVVTLMSAQTGLNLTAAGHVIFADLYWTPAAHQQFIERAYARLSDLHGADAYFFLATGIPSGSIMEWIWHDVLAGKIQTINATVEGIDEERETGTLMGIIQKFKDLKQTLMGTL